MIKDTTLVIFGKNVQKLRKQKEWSQEKLAELAGLHRTYIGMIERAEKNITIVSGCKIAKALDTQIAILLSDEV